MPCNLSKPFRRWFAYTARLVCLGGGFWFAAATAGGKPSDDFVGNALPPEWSVHLGGAASLALTNHTLVMASSPHTRAFVAHSFPHGTARVVCELKTSNETAPAGLVLRWDAANYVQFGLNNPSAGRLELREVLGTYPHDFDLGAAAAVGEWQTLAVELAGDCVRYLAATNGGTFVCLHVSPRPARMHGAPQDLELGQQFDGKLFPRPTPWINPPSDQITNFVCFRELHVSELAGTEVTASVGEQAELSAAGHDVAGETELAAPGDPSFASVSAYYPAMKWPREIVGVKDHDGAIGLACDGSLQLTDNIARYDKPTAFFQLGDYRFGGRNQTCGKKLLHGWMPVVMATDQFAGLAMEETVYGWSQDFVPDAALYCYVRLSITNTADQLRSTSLSFAITGVSNQSPGLQWSLKLPPHAGQTVFVRLPYAIELSTAMEVSQEEYGRHLAAVTNYWNQLIGQGSRFEIPEDRVANAYRAWLVYNFLNAAKRDGVFQVCDGAGFYGRVYGYSAALYCHGMDLMGYPDQAATYADSLLTFVHTNGLLAVNFGDTDTGTTLWMLAEHYRLTRDRSWLQRITPKMHLMCQWIVDHRQLAVARAASEPVVSRGLIRYRPYADLLHPAADYFSNGYLWKGLDATARVFAEAGSPGEGSALQREADAYRRDIQASMQAAVFVDHGLPVLPMIPDTHELWQESDGSADGYYGIIAPCLLEIGLPTGHEPQAKLIVDALEQRGGLVAGVSQFHRMADHAYTYGYWLNCLERDDVKRAILGLYGALAYGMSRDTFAAVECMNIRTGENYWMLPHTYSNTQQLRLLRNLLVREEGDNLWLAQAVPRPWLAAGLQVGVNAAPTTFGPVSYRIVPQADGSMRVQISPPASNPPGEIILRLRDPRSRVIASVRSDGPGEVTFSGETVRLAGVRSPVNLQVTFLL